MNIRKRIALITVLIIIMNLFAPYSILFHNTVQAATGTLEEKPVLISNRGITTVGSTRMLCVQLGIASEEIFNGLDIVLKFDKTKITPCDKASGATTALKTKINFITEQSNFFEADIFQKTYDKDTSQFLYTIAVAGGIDIVDSGYVPGETEDAEIDEAGQGYGGYLPIIRMYFKVLDDSITADTLPTDLFNLSPSGLDVPTGAKVSYKNAAGKDVSKDITSLAYNGFAEGQKTITGIAVKDNPTNTTYEHGEAVDLTGGTITVTYDDNSTEEISMQDPNVSIKSGDPANVDAPTVEIDYKGHLATFPITVTDPITGFAVKTPMTNLEYTHDTALDFTGLTLEATTKSGKKVPLTQTSTGVTTDAGISGGALKADVNSTYFTKTSPDGEIPVKGTQKIKFSYEGFDAYQTIVVNDTISSVNVINQPTKAIYKAGETLNLSGAVVQVTLGSGTKTNINLPDGAVTISTHNTTLVGAKQLLTATVGGHTAPETIDIEYYDYITKAEFTEPDKGEYNLGEALDLTGGRIKVTWKKAGIKNVNLTSAMVSTLDSSIPGIKTLTVTYNVEYTLSDGTKIPDTFTDTFDVEVVNSVTSITIDPPSKTTYLHGENLATDGTIILHYADDTTNTVPYAANIIVKESDGTAVNMSPSNYDATQKVSKILKLSYTDPTNGKTGNADYPIEIINNIKSIAIHSTNHKTSFNINEPLDLTNLEILVTRASGEPEVVAVKDNSKAVVKGFSSTAENPNLPLTIEYTENNITKTTSYNVSITDQVTAINSITFPHKEYKHNDELNLSGASINVQKGSGAVDIPLTPAMVKGYDKDKLGDQKLTIEYGGQTATDAVTVKVKDYVKEITLSESTIEGTYGEELQDIIDRLNLTYTVHYSKAGAKEAVKVATSMIDGYNKNTTTTQNLKVVYKDGDTNSFTVGDDFDKDINITLRNSIIKIDIQKPTKTTYTHGQSIDKTGATVTLTYADGDTAPGDLSKLQITEADGSSVNMSPASYNATQKVQKTLKLSYTEGGKTETADYPIEIINDIKGITIHSTNHKISYNVNDSLDITNLEILVTRASGAPEVVKITDPSKVTGFSSTVENSSLPLTVNYTENGITKTATYTVSVADQVTAINSITFPHKEYKYGDELNLNGASINVQKGSGAVDIPLTTSMIKGYDKEILGDQKLTIEYGGQTATDAVTVNVKDYVTGITLNKTTVNGEYGNELVKIISDNTITYTVNYAKAGATTASALSTSMVKTTYDKTKTGTQILNIEYEDTNANSFTNGTKFPATLTVNLTSQIKAVKITEPTKKDYIHGDALNLAGATITVTYSDDSTDTVDISNATVTIEDGLNKANMAPTTYDLTQKVTKNVTLTYTTSNGKTGTLTYPIVITNTIEKIEIATSADGAGITAPKIDYKVKETFDDTKGSIKVTRKNGTTSIIPLSHADISIGGFSSATENTSLPLTVSYTENGIQKSTGYTVSVRDSVESIISVNLPKKTYNYDQELELTGATITVKKSSGNETIPLKASMISGYNKKQLGAQELTITYGGQTAKETVTVKDYIKDTIFTRPTKITYEYGTANLDLSGGKIQVIMASGASTPDILLTDTSKVTLSGYNLSQEGAQTVNVKYGDKNFSFGIIVEDNIKEIAMKTEPKKDYKYGEPLSVAGGKITVTKSSGKTQEVDLTTSMVSNFNPNKLGEQTLKVTYKGKETTYKVEVKDFVKDIILTAPSKNVYKIGESLDLKGGTVQTLMASGAKGTAVAITESMISDFSTKTEGAKTVKVTYEGKTKTFPITVVDSIQDIRLKTLPTKLDYKYGEALDVKGGSIEIIKSSGNQTIALTSSMVKGYDAKKLGVQTLKVIYEGKEIGEFKVDVKDYITKLDVKPSKTEYEYGESLDLKGAKVSVITASGKVQETVDMTASMLSGFDNTKVGKQAIIVNYLGLKSAFNVEVTDKVKGIAIEKHPDKINFAYGEEIDVTGGTLEVIKSSGKSSVKITKDMISGYNKNQSGAQVITVTYSGFTAKFIVVVGEKPVKPVTPTKPVTPSKPTTPTIPKVEIPEKPVVEEPVKPVIEEPIVEQPPVVEEPVEEKPTAVLGVQEEKPDLVIPTVIGGAGLLMLILLLATKRNTKVYVEENGKFELGGVKKLHKRKPYLNIDKYLDGETYLNKVKVVLNEKISKKLDGKELEIKHRGISKKYTVTYKDEPFELILE